MSDENQRDRILGTPSNVINRDGVRASDLRVGGGGAQLTRGGLLYHFPSRRHCGGSTRAQFTGLGDVDGSIAGQDRRAGHCVGALPDLRARVSAQSATRAELLMFMLESADPDAEEPVGTGGASLGTAAAGGAGKRRR